MRRLRSTNVSQTPIEDVVSCSSAKSKSRAMTKSVRELIWIYQLLVELGFEITTPEKMCCDNQAALHIATN